MDIKPIFARLLDAFTGNPPKSETAVVLPEQNITVAQTEEETATEIQLPKSTKPKLPRQVRALYDFIPTEAGELRFRKGDVIVVLESVYKDWWKGLLRGQMGIFPTNYVEVIEEGDLVEISELETEMVSLSVYFSFSVRN
jgi:signal transducing adaptor molecule